MALSKKQKKYLARIAIATGAIASAAALGYGAKKASRKRRVRDGGPLFFGRPVGESWINSQSRERNNEVVRGIPRMSTRQTSIPVTRNTTIIPRRMPAPWHALNDDYDDTTYGSATTFADDDDNATVYDD